MERHRTPTPILDAQVEWLANQPVGQCRALLEHALPCQLSLTVAIGIATPVRFTVQVVNHTSRAGLKNILPAPVGAEPDALDLPDGVDEVAANLAGAVIRFPEDPRLSVIDPLPHLREKVEDSFLGQQIALGLIKTKKRPAFPRTI